MDTPACSSAILRCHCNSSDREPSLLLSSWAHICRGRVVCSRTDWMQSFRNGAALRTGMMMLTMANAGSDSSALCACIVCDIYTEESFLLHAFVRDGAFEARESSQRRHSGCTSLAVIAIH